MNHLKSFLLIIAGLSTLCTAPTNAMRPEESTFQQWLARNPGATVDQAATLGRTPKEQDLYRGIWLRRVGLPGIQQQLTQQTKIARQAQQNVTDLQHQLAALQNENRQLHAERERLIAQIRELAAALEQTRVTAPDVADLQRRLDAALVLLDERNRRITKLTTQIETLTREHDEAREEARAALAHVNELTNRLRQAEERIRKLEEIHTMAEARIEDLNKRLVTMDQRIEVLNEQITTKDTEITRLREALERRPEPGDLNELRLQLQQVIAERNQLVGELKQLREQLLEANARIAELEKENARLDLDRELIEAQRRRVPPVPTPLPISSEDQIRELQEQNRQLQAQLAAQPPAKPTPTPPLKPVRLTPEYLELQAENKRLADANAMLQEKINNLELKELAARSQEKDLAKAQAELEKAKTTLAEPAAPPRELVNLLILLGIDPKDPNVPQALGTLNQLLARLLGITGIKQGTPDAVFALLDQLGGMLAKLRKGIDPHTPTEQILPALNAYLARLLQLQQQIGTHENISALLSDIAYLLSQLDTLEQLVGAEARGGLTAIIKSWHEAPPAQKTGFERQMLTMAGNIAATNQNVRSALARVQTQLKQIKPAKKKK